MNTKKISKIKDGFRKIKMIIKRPSLFISSFHCKIKYFFYFFQEKKKEELNENSDDMRNKNEMKRNLSKDEL